MRITKIGTEQKSKKELAIEGFNNVAMKAIKDVYGAEPVPFGTKLGAGCMTGVFSGDEECDTVYLVMHCIEMGKKLVMSRYTLDEGSSVSVDFGEDEE